MASLFAVKAMLSLRLRQPRDLSTIAESRHSGRSKGPCPSSLRDCQIGILPHSVRAADKTAGSNRITNQHSIAYDITATYDRVHHLTLESASFIDRITGAGAYVFAAVRVFAVDHAGYYREGSLAHGLMSSKLYWGTTAGSAVSRYQSHVL
jgi:hypothetical protein